MEFRKKFVGVIRALVATGVVMIAVANGAAAQDSSSMHSPAPHHAMMMFEPLGISMNRMGSGTTWVPSAAPVPSWNTMVGGWDITSHGFVFAQSDGQSGARGASQIGSLNWGMLMASREIDGGRFQARTMLSLDPLTVTPRGYPLLLQSGETYHGEPLHDRQHPHDFLMELGALYERPVTHTFGVSAYAAPSGEPALGPVAFMHRPSAMDNPTAPIGHHWQDATHITFGVLTAGVFGNKWKLEGSTFNGREPDENRWDIDPIRFDSYSGRLTLQPSDRWSFTGGYGYIHQPEGTGTMSLHRAASSLLYGAPFRTEGQWATALIWGANVARDEPLSHSVLGEVEMIFDPRNTIISRLEFVQKDAEDLSLDPARFPNATARFNVGQLSLGYIREIVRVGGGGTLGLGAMAMFSRVPESLHATYGTTLPRGAFLFLRLRPRLPRTSDMAGMPGM